MRPHAEKQTAKENVARPSCRLGDLLEAMVLGIRLGFPANFTNRNGIGTSGAEGASSYLLVPVLTIRGRCRPLLRNRASRRLREENSTRTVILVTENRF